MNGSERGEGRGSGEDHDDTRRRPRRLYGSSPRSRPSLPDSNHHLRARHIVMGACRLVCTHPKSLRPSSSVDGRSSIRPPRPAAGLRRPSKHETQHGDRPWLSRRYSISSATLRYARKVVHRRHELEEHRINSTQIAHTKFASCPFGSGQLFCSSRCLLGFPR